MKVKTAIFDLDGTLLNTLASLANCYNRVLASHGLRTHEIDAYRYFIGNGARNCLLACLRTSGELARLSGNDIEALLKAQRDDYGASWQTDVAIYPGINELIDDLLRHQISLAVLTNKDHDFAVETVNHFFPGKPFKVIQGYSDKIPHKPDPTGAKHIAMTMGHDPTEIIIIGDTSVDIATGQAAGFITIGALWGFRGRDELEAAGANHIAATPSDIVRFLNLS